MVVLVSLIICLIPKIFPSIDPESKSGGASGVKGILWPICYMIGCVSILVNVFLVQSHKNSVITCVTRLIQRILSSTLLQNRLSVDLLNRKIKTKIIIFCAILPD